MRPPGGILAPGESLIATGKFISRVLPFLFIQIFPLPSPTLTLALSFGHSHSKFKFTRVK